MTDYQDLSKEQVLRGFVASRVEDVASRLGVEPGEMYRRMDAVGMIDQYLIPFYATLHTESRENLTDSLIATLKRWEEAKRKMTFLSQPLADKYLTFIESIQL